MRDGGSGTEDVAEESEVTDSVAARQQTVAERRPGRRRRLDMRPRSAATRVATGVLKVIGK